MADIPSTPSADNLSGLLASLLSNNELMEKVSSIIGTGSAEEEKKEEGRNKTDMGTMLSDPVILSKLPEVISVLRPMLEPSAKASPPSGEHSSAVDHRTALLCALKPYLSPKRCEAIDYFTRISKLGDMVRNMKL